MVLKPGLSLARDSQALSTFKDDGQLEPPWPRAGFIAPTCDQNSIRSLAIGIAHLERWRWRCSVSLSWKLTPQYKYPRFFQEHITYPKQGRFLEFVQNWIQLIKAKRTSKPDF